MKYYKDINNKVYAYSSDGSQDAYIKADLVAITLEERDAILNPPKTLAEAEQEARDRIKAGFIDALSNGSYQSTVTNLLTDNRRSGIDNDKDNLVTMMNIGTYPIDWICKDGVFSIPDVATAQALKDEMELDGLSKYQNKFTKQAQIDNLKALEGDATTPTSVADYNLVVW
jgi:hypothetical protein